MQHDWRTSPSGTGGIAVRRGAAVVLIRDGDVSQDPLVDDLLAALDAAADDPAPGRRLARRVAGLVSQADPDAVPDLCLLAATDGGGLAAFLVGAAELSIDTGSGIEERLSGQDVSTWVDRVLRPPLHRLGAYLTGTPVAEPARRRADLRDGSVPAGAVVLEISGASDGRTTDLAMAQSSAASPVVVVELSVQEPVAPPPPPDEPTIATPVPTPAAAAPAPPPQADPPPPPAPQPAAAPAASVPSQPGAPQPVRDPALAGAAANGSGGHFVSVSLAEPLPAEELIPLPVTAQQNEQAEVQVLGISCSRGHFNDPASAYCASCGISLVHQTHNLVPGPRSALGVLVVDDGRVFTLNKDYVLGREPETADTVVQDKALPLSLDDPDRTLSRVHAAVTLHDWSVRVVDLGSANGTYVDKAGAGEWERLVPQEPTTLRPGASIRIGNRVLVFDSHRKS